MGINNKIISRANKIKDDLLNLNNKIINTKVSKYNKNKLCYKCELCGTTKNLDTHHIRQQSESNIRGFMKDGWHKNKEFNLIIICKACHHKVHKSEINISLPVRTSNGYIIKCEK
jgi:DNA mismatch repair protein MutS